MSKSEIRFISFPKTQPPPEYIGSIVDVFKKKESMISTIDLKKGLISDRVMNVLTPGLKALNFNIETGKTKAKKISRPVFFGEDGQPTLKYEIDAYHTDWRCGLEIEAGRAILGNAVYRDLFQAMIMVDVDHLCLAVPNMYKYKSRKKDMEMPYYKKTVSIVDALFGHGRVSMPYSLSIIGY